MTTQLIRPEADALAGGSVLPGVAELRTFTALLGAADSGLALAHPLADADRIDRLRALEELKAAASSAQALLAAELDVSRRRAEAALGVPSRERGKGVGHEVALARRESPHAGSRLLGLGKALVAEMPHTLAALRSGAISEWRATLLVRETACLTREDRQVVDVELAGTPKAVKALSRMGTRAVVSAARRVAYRLDPYSAVDRSARAAEDRYVSIRPAPDCMTLVSALLPVAQGVATYAALKGAADSARAAGDGRTRGQVMADALVTRVTGQASADAVPVCVDLVLDADALLGTGTGTAEVTARGVPDVGPVPAAVAKRILAASPSDGRWLRRLFARPAAHDLVSADSRRRCFPDGLARLVTLVEPACRTPWCDAPVAHVDHVVDHADGGETSLSNAQGLCEACSYVKSLPGWRATPLGHGPGPPTSVETTTPTGHTYASGRIGPSG